MLCLIFRMLIFITFDFTLMFNSYSSILHYTSGYLGLLPLLMQGKNICCIT